MSWLDELKYRHRYKCSSCGLLLEHESNQDEFGGSTHDSCGGTLEYHGFVPMKFRMTTKISYERNGRIAYAITDGSGKVHYVSKMADTYYNTGVIKEDAGFSNEYRQVAKDQVKDAVLQHSQATVSEAGKSALTEE